MIKIPNCQNMSLQLCNFIILAQSFWLRNFKGKCCSTWRDFQCFITYSIYRPFDLYFLAFSGQELVTNVIPIHSFVITWIIYIQIENVNSLLIFKFQDFFSNMENVKFEQVFPSTHLDINKFDSNLMLVNVNKLKP
jgi:hypothetical protein